MSTPKPGRNEAKVHEFVEHFGALMQASGMPGLAGHVFALLLAAPDARLTAQEIKQMLDVSPAAVSTATSYLANIGLTRKMREVGSRRIVHALIDEDWYATMLRRNNVVAATQRILEEGVDAAGGMATEAGRRLWLNSEMFRYLGDALQTAIAGWEQRKVAAVQELSEPPS